MKFIHLGTFGGDKNNNTKISRLYFAQGRAEVEQIQNLNI